MNEAQPSLLTAVQVRLYLFGPFRLEKDNRPVRLPTAQIRSLLAYLVLHPESHSREKLAALLWGDFTDVQARASLRNALAVLRKHLGTDLLLADRQTVQLNPAYPLWVDALQFQQQAAAKLDLYQDDLLIDFYDDWIGPEREYYRNLYLETLLQLGAIPT